MDTGESPPRDGQEDREKNVNGASASSIYMSMSCGPKIVIYGNEYCSYCTAARMLLTKRGLSFDDIKVSGDENRREEMVRLSGSHSVPQIFINDQLVGGFDELYALAESGGLDNLLGS